MINFRGTCPRCNRLSLVNLETPCPNTFGDGRVCGYALTTDVMSGNHTYRTKEAKHTSPPPSGSRGDHSWTSSGLYDLHQTAIRVVARPPGSHPRPPHHLRRPVGSKPLVATPR